MDKIDMSIIGKRFGDLTVIRFDHMNNRRNSCWLCECDCGNTIVLPRKALVSGNTSSCGCRKHGPQREDLVGKQFGRLTVIAFDHADRYRNKYWVCECECGNRTIVTGGDLKSGNTTSCGCYQIEGIRERATTHGLSRTPLYKVWRSIHDRCENPNIVSYHRYGGRGISVCEEWARFENFRDWALSSGYEQGLTIDRIDNDDGYHREIKIKQTRGYFEVYVNGDFFCTADTYLEAVMEVYETYN